MKFSGIHYESFCDGEGVRVVLFVSGCEHKCKGCHNPETWDPDYGYEYTDDIKDLINEKLQKPFISGLTLSGGDPFLNPKDSYLATVDLNYKNLWIYTGYKFEDLIKRIKDNKYILLLMSLADVIVDGTFMCDKADKSLAFRGSSNQRIIDVKRSLAEKKTVLYM